MAAEAPVLPVRGATIGNRRQIVILAAVLASAAALRIYLALACTALPDFSDMETYNLLALRGGISVSPPPGYPLFLRLVYFLFGPRNYTAVFLVQGLLSTVTVWMIYRATAAVSSVRAALIAAGVSAVYPNFLVYNLLTMSEALGILLSVSIVLLLVSSVPGRVKAPLSALLLVAGCAVRPVLLYFWPGMLLGLRRKVIFALSTLLLLSPWIIYGIATGRSSNRPGRAFYKTYNPRSNGRQYVKFSDTPLAKTDLPNGVYFKEAFRFILNNKWKTIDIIYNKAAMIFAKGWDEHFMHRVVGTGEYRRAIMIYAFVPIMLLGFAGMIVVYGERNRIVAFLVSSYLLAFILLAIFKVRYRVLVEPMLIIYAAILIDTRFLPGGGSADTRGQADPKGGNVDVRTGRVAGGGARRRAGAPGGIGRPESGTGEKASPESGAGGEW